MSLGMKWWWAYIAECGELMYIINRAITLHPFTLFSTAVSLTSSYWYLLSRIKQ